MVIIRIEFLLFADTARKTPIAAGKLAKKRRISTVVGPLRSSDEESVASDKICSSKKWQK